MTFKYASRTKLKTQLCNQVWSKGASINDVKVFSGEFKRGVGQKLFDVIYGLPLAKYICLNLTCSLTILLYVIFMGVLEYFSKLKPEQCWYRAQNFISPELFY